jgi:tetratricopeptide (TPR) repeat protein
MRIVVFAFAMALAASARAADMPNPPACADYAQQGADPHGCDAAIASETDPAAKSVLLMRRGYMKDASGDYSQYFSALTDLTQAAALWPQNWRALAEQAYLLNELDMPDKAEASLDAADKINPDYPQLYQERALAHFNLGNLQAAFEDRDKQTQMLPNDAGARGARARALMWLGRFDEASKDIEQAAALAKQNGDAGNANWADRLRTELKLWTAWSDPSKAAKACQDANDMDAILKPDYIGNCTRAYFDANTRKDAADALSQRSVALQVVLQREAAGLEDLRLAMIFDPGPDRAFNYGSRLVAVGQSHQALRYLDDSIQAKPGFYNYAERAAAKYALGDFNASFADAKKSFEIKPNEVALTVLGDLLYDKHDIAAAKLYWTGAYKLGDRDDGLKARLAKIGVSWPPPDDGTSSTPPR